jgi:hypothetical protein
MNHGAPPSPACKASSFTDDFSTGSFDGAAWARNYITAGSTLTEHDGIAELHSAER